MVTGTQKLYRLKFLTDKVKEANNQGKIVIEENLISEMAMTWGTARRTALEYLKQLELTKKIKRVEGEIYDYEKYMDINALKEMDAEDIKKELEGGNEYGTTTEGRADEHSATSTSSSSSDMGVSEEEAKDNHRESGERADSSESSA